MPVVPRRSMSTAANESDPDGMFATLTPTPVGPAPAAWPMLVAPVTAKAPLVLLRLTPFEAAPVAVTLANVTPFAPIAVLVMFTGLPVVVLTVFDAPVTLTVP